MKHCLRAIILDFGKTKGDRADGGMIGKIKGDFVGPWKKEK